MKTQHLTAGIFLWILLLIQACSGDKGPVPADCDTNPVTLQSVNVTPATCGKNDGSIEVIASGGSGNYLYSMDGVNFQQSNIFGNLSAGNYDLAVKDDNECEAAVTASVETNSGISLAVNILNAGCGMSAGSITIDVTGGMQPFTYGIQGGSSQSDNQISGLAAGNYTVFAEDATGCRVTSPATVLNGTSLSKDIMPILTTNCTFSGCHDGKSGLPDWNIKQNVIDKASLIKQKTQSGEMPKGGTLPAEDIQAIACWVDDGAPDN